MSWMVHDPPAPTERASGPVLAAAAGPADLEQRRTSAHRSGSGEKELKGGRRAAADPAVAYPVLSMVAFKIWALRRRISAFFALRSLLRDVYLDRSSRRPFEARAARFRVGFFAGPWLRDAFFFTGLWLLLSRRVTSFFCILVPLGLRLTAMGPQYDGGTHHAIDAMSCVQIEGSERRGRSRHEVLDGNGSIPLVRLNSKLKAAPGPCQQA